MRIEIEEKAFWNGYCQGLSEILAFINWEDEFIKKEDLDYLIVSRLGLHDQSGVFTKAIEDNKTNERNNN